MNTLFNLSLIILGSIGFGLFCTHEIVTLKKIKLNKILNNVLLISGMVGVLILATGFLGIMAASKNKIDKFEREKDYYIYKDLIDNDAIVNEHLLDHIKNFNDNITKCNENWDNLWFGCYYGEYYQIPYLDYDAAVKSFEKHNK